jgi:L-ascorbate metabolism protein UlaG (beta-lactamase superfamily)
LLKIRYHGDAAFVLKSDEMSVLINPGVIEERPLVPDDIKVRLIVATNHADDALGNATIIAQNSKAWILGNEETIAKVKEQGGKPWLLHVLKSEQPYELPEVKITPYSLSRKEGDSGMRYENLGLYIEMSGMKVGYLGHAVNRGPFEEFDMDVLITPIRGEDVFEVKDAISLCIDSKPRIAVPMLWDSTEQTQRFFKYISQFGQGIVPVILEPGQTLEIGWRAGTEFVHSLS